MVSQSLVSWVTKAWAWVFCFDTLEMSGARRRRRRRRNAKTKGFLLSANANNDSPWLLIVYNFLNINKVFNVKLNVFWKYSHHLFNNWLNVVRFNIKWIWHNKLFSVSIVGKLCFGNPRKRRVRRFFISPHFLPKGFEIDHWRASWVSTFDIFWWVWIHHGRPVNELWGWFKWFH